MAESSLIYVGMDVHKDSIDIALAEAGERGEVRHYGTIGGALGDVDRALRKIIAVGGNSRARRMLTEAAWSYRLPARVTPIIAKRQDGQPREVRDISWKAQVRLCGRYRLLRGRGKEPNKVVIAVARELAGFVWAIARTVRP